MAAVILLAGGVIAVWSSQQQKQQVTEIKATVRGLCEAVARGKDITEPLRAQGLLIASDINGALHSIFAQSPDMLDLIVIEVQPGDAGHPLAGRGEVTHTAMILVGDQPRLGLAIRHSNEAGGIPGAGVRIVGYWWPGGQ